MIGEEVGGYTILSELGRGAVGVVYLARHPSLNRLVAIKFLQAGFSDRPDLVKRFFAEARAATTIDHPGIVRVLGCDVHSGGRAYIVMEYLQGQTLRTHLANRGRLTVSAAASIGVQAAYAAAAAHAKGIVHRDLKPDNIFLLSDPVGDVRILDFGIAKLMQRNGDPSDTRNGVVLGTPSYMSPEQARGAKVDGQADVYSLGCILFEMLCGRTPFLADDADSQLTAHMHQAPPLPSALAPSLPGSLDLLVQRMLAKQPADRPHLQDQVIPTLQSLIGSVATVPGGEGAPGPGPPVAAARGLGGRRRAAVAGVLVAVVGVAWLAQSRLSGRDRPSPPQPPTSPVMVPSTPPLLPATLPDAAPLKLTLSAPAVVAPEPAAGSAPRPRAVGAPRPTLARQTGRATGATRQRLSDPVINTEPPGALVCIPGQPARVGFANAPLVLDASRPPTALLLYRRGFRVEKAAPPSAGSPPITVHLRPLADDDLQPPPPCR